MAWEAISAEEVSKICGVSPGSLRDEWYEMAVSLIERQAGIHNPGKTTSIDERQNGSGFAYQKVLQPPIASVSAVYVDSILLPSDRYINTDTSIVLVDDFSAANPYVLGGAFPEGSKNIRIVYTSGTTLDHGVNMAIALIVKELSVLNTQEGAEARLMTFRPGESVATEEPLIQWGIHGKIRGIISTLIGKKFKAA